MPLERTSEREQLVQQRTEELNQAYRLLERLDKTKSDFINVIAHELRTPLTNMRAQIEAIQDGLAQPQPEVIASLR